MLVRNLPAELLQCCSVPCFSLNQWVSFGSFCLLACLFCFIFINVKNSFQYTCICGSYLNVIVANHTCFSSQTDWRQVTDLLLKTGSLGLAGLWACGFFVLFCGLFFGLLCVFVVVVVVFPFGEPLSSHSPPFFSQWLFFFVFYNESFIARVCSCLAFEELGPSMGVSGRFTKHIPSSFL